jgi:hypothetical protein
MSKRTRIVLVVVAVLIVIGLFGNLGSKNSSSSANTTTTAAPNPTTSTKATTTAPKRTTTTERTTTTAPPTTTTAAPSASGIEIGPGPESTYSVQPQPSAGTCHYTYVYSYPLPDSHCTPGAVNPQVSQANIGSTICRSGYTSTIRPPESVTEQEKYASAAAYGYTGSLHTAEYDHLIPLEMGGDPNDPGSSALPRRSWPSPPTGWWPTRSTREAFRHPPPRRRPPRHRRQRRRRPPRTSIPVPTARRQGPRARQWTGRRWSARRLPPTVGIAGDRSSSRWESGMAGDLFAVAVKRSPLLEAPVGAC